MFCKLDYLVISHARLLASGGRLGKNEETPFDTTFKAGSDYQATYRASEILHQDPHSRKIAPKGLPSRTFHGVRLTEVNSKGKELRVIKVYS